MASNFTSSGLQKMLGGIVVGTNSVDLSEDGEFAVNFDTNYRAHSVSEFGFTSSTTSTSYEYHNQNNVYYFDKTLGEGAAATHSSIDISNIIISTGGSVLYVIPISSSITSIQQHQQVKIGKYVSGNRGISISLSIS